MLQAQTSVNMALNGATGTFSIAPSTTCAINFYDSGGPANQYNNGSDAYVTFLPSNSATHRIQAQFLSMGLEAWSAMRSTSSTATPWVSTRL
jgi:hypothetical protein